LILVVFVAAFFIAIVVYPLVIYFLDRRGSHPLHWLAAMVPTALIATLAGDGHVALGTTARLMRENLGTPRRIGGTVSPLVAIFGRAGTVMVAVAGFLLVIRSYTALEIGFGEIVSLAMGAIVYSFLMVRVPTGGVVVLLSFVSSRYGRGMEDSYLILVPAMLVLERIAAFLDAMTVGFVAQAIAIRHEYRHEIDTPV
jgi:Na+/H+-dicarboxylate symporter